MLSAKCLAQMAFPRFRTPRWVDLTAGLAASVVAFILGADALGNGGVLVAIPPALFPLLVVGLGLTLVAVHLSVIRLHSFRRPLALQPLAWVAVALTLAATSWSSQRYNSGKLRMEIDTLACFAGELVMTRRLAGVTDRGREVELYHWTNESVNAADPFASAGPNSENGRANCYGWVFAGGEHLLTSDGVERILEDNGYNLCQSPQAGDIIIYRNSDRIISHVGLVKAAPLWGEPVIESKWGLADRFVHSPEEQPYGNNYQYFRSARQGHSLAILPAKPAMSIASN